MSAKKKISKAIDLSGFDPTNLSISIKMVSFHIDCPDGFAFISSIAHNESNTKRCAIEDRFGVMVILCSKSLELVAHQAMQFFEERKNHKKESINDNNDKFFEEFVRKLDIHTGEALAAVWKIGSECFLFHTGGVFVDIQTKKDAVHESLYQFNALADAPIVDKSECIGMASQGGRKFALLAHTRVLISNSKEIPNGFPEDLTLQSILVPIDKKHIKLRKKLPGASGSDGLLLLEFFENEIEKDLKRKQSKRLISIVSGIILVAFFVVLAALKGIQTSEEPIEYNSSSYAENQSADSNYVCTEKAKSVSDCSRKNMSSVNTNETEKSRPNESVRPNEKAQPSDNNKVDSEFYIENANPQVLRQAMPQVPESLRNVEGIVVLEVVVDSKGIVQSAKVLKSTEDKLNPIAIETSKKYLFRPAYQGGKPISGVSKVTIRFKGN